MSNNKNNGSVENVKDFLEHINKIVKPETQKASKVLFRGQESAEWPIETSAHRRLRGKSNEKIISEEQELYYNIRLIEQFKHGDFHSPNSSEMMKNDLGILAQLQHQGAATSLIDFSDNPLVALWFACQESPKSVSDHNGQVFILSTSSNKYNFEEIDSIEQIEYYKVSIPDQLHNPKIDGILNDPTFFYWKPAHLNNRITAQQSYFLIGKRKLPEMEKISIEENSKFNILKELLSVYGINEVTLYPDLVGFAQANSSRSSYDQETQNETQKFIYKKSIFRLNKKIKENSEDYDSYSKRGVAKYKLDDYKGAIDDWSEVIKVNPNNATIYYNCGVAKGKLKDYKRAIDNYDKAIKYNPDYADAYNNRGDAKDQLKDNKGAMDDYNKAIKIDPNHADAYNNRGAAKYELKDNKGAMDDYNKAIEINPNYATAYNNRGDAKIKLEDYKGAIDDYQTVLKHSKDTNLTEIANKNIKLGKAKLKEVQNKFSKDKK